MEGGLVCSLCVLVYVLVYKPTAALAAIARQTLGRDSSLRAMIQAFEQWIRSSGGRSCVEGDLLIDFSDSVWAFGLIDSGLLVNNTIKVE